MRTSEDKAALAESVLQVVRGVAAKTQAASEPS